MTRPASPRDTKRKSRNAPYFPSSALNVKAVRFWPGRPGAYLGQHPRRIHPTDGLRSGDPLPGAWYPEAMRRAVRVFIGEGIFCPGFQLKDGFFHELVLDLFDAISLKIPHNVFAAWMVCPLPAESRSPPVDILGSMTLLQSSLAAFADRYRPVEKRR